MSTHIKLKTKNIDLYVIYRYPNTSMLNFIECLSKIIEGNILNDHGELVLMGDFNVHMNSPEAPDTILFNNFLDSLNLKSLVDFLTHLSNHSIDLIITDKNSSLIHILEEVTCSQIITSSMLIFKLSHNHHLLRTSNTGNSNPYHPVTLRLT